MSKKGNEVMAQFIGVVIVVLLFFFGLPIFIGIMHSLFGANEDNLAIGIAVISTVINIIVFFWDEDDILIVKLGFLGISSYCFFWAYTIVSYDFTSVWEAVKAGFFAVLIYIICMVVIWLLLHLIKPLELMRRAKENKWKREQRKAAYETSLLYDRLAEILDTAQKVVEEISNNKVVTPEATRKLLLLFSSLSASEVPFELGKDRTSATIQLALEKVKRLNSVMKEFKGNMDSFRDNEKIASIRDKAVALIGELEQYQQYLKGESVTLPDVYRQEDQHLFFTEKIKKDIDLIHRQIKEQSNITFKEFA